MYGVRHLRSLRPIIDPVWPQVVYQLVKPLFDNLEALSSLGDADIRCGPKRRCCAFLKDVISLLACAAVPLFLQLMACRRCVAEGTGPHTPASAMPSRRALFILSVQRCSTATSLQSMSGGNQTADWLLGS